MKNNKQQEAPQTMLYTNTLFSNKEYNLNTKDQLRISEISASVQKSEVIPLDMIEATPTAIDKIDPQWLAFTLVCGLASGIFAMMALHTGLSVTHLFSALFFLASLGSLYTAFNNKIRSYTYHYANTNTPLFTLKGSQLNSFKLVQFVENLSELIQKSSTKEDIQAKHLLEKNIEKIQPSAEEQDYLTYTYHLDYLHASGLVDEASYRKIGQNISNRIFGREQKSESETNIINFPR